MRKACCVHEQDAYILADEVAFGLDNGSTKSPIIIIINNHSKKYKIDKEEVISGYQEEKASPANDPSPAGSDPGIWLHPLSRRAPEILSWRRRGLEGAK